MKLKDIVINLWTKILVYKELAINLWCGLLILNLVCNLYWGGAAAAINIFTLIGRNLKLCLVPKFYLYYFALPVICLVSNVFWFHFVLEVARWLSRVHSIFNWSWLGMNMNLLPLLKRYLGPVFILLLMLNLPSITAWEEATFRVGTTNWQTGLVNSILFGMTHCIIGIPVGAGIALITLGLWLTWCYLMAGPIFVAIDVPPMFDGHAFATMNHTTFNMVGCIMMFLFLIKKHLEDSR
ncbi:MAG: hypothetical protein HY226_05465 [Candidatus Vogelbacteria bacterium]|nr:hypothetical protein [Candidatus Vogelbacteria bacterium]